MFKCTKFNSSIFFKVQLLQMQLLQGQTITGIETGESRYNNGGCLTDFPKETNRVGGAYYSAKTRSLGET